MILGETPTVVQRSPVSSVEFDQDPRYGFGAAVEDADTIVREAEPSI